MSKRPWLLAAAFITLQASPGRPQPPTLCGQPFTSNLAAMYERIRQLPGATVAPSRNPDFDVISLPGQAWIFTKSSHPAYPSAACRRIIQVDGDKRAETKLVCHAARAECDRLAADYAALDKQMTEAFKPQQAPMQ